MSGNRQQWAALDSQHERLVDGTSPMHRPADRSRGRKRWHQRIVAAVIAPQQPAHRLARRRPARPQE
jgi:hypothetical protein